MAHRAIAADHRILHDRPSRADDVVALRRAHDAVKDHHGGYSAQNGGVVVLLWSPEDGALPSGQRRGQGVRRRGRCCRRRSAAVGARWIGAAAAAAHRRQPVERQRNHDDGGQQEQEPASIVDDQLRAGAGAQHRARLGAQQRLRVALALLLRCSPAHVRRRRRGLNDGGAVNQPCWQRATGAT
jgi:hypothetical protein